MGRGFPNDGNGGGVNGWLALNSGSGVGRAKGSSEGNEREVGHSSSGVEYGGKLGIAGEDGGIHCRGAL